MSQRRGGWRAAVGVGADRAVRSAKKALSTRRGKLLRVAAFAYLVICVCALLRSLARARGAARRRFIPFHSEFELVRPVRPGVSVVAACNQHLPDLSDALLSWTRFADEVVLVDWSAQEPLADSTGLTQLEHVRVVRVNGEDAWFPARAYNLAVALAVFDTVVFSPCGCTLTVRLKETLASWMAGNADGGSACLVEGVEGNLENLRDAVLAVKRRAFKSVGGFDERVLSGVGPFGADLVLRLRNASFHVSRTESETQPPVLRNGIGSATRIDAELDVKVATRTSAVLRVLRKAQPSFSSKLGDGLFSTYDVVKSIRWKDVVVPSVLASGRTSRRISLEMPSDTGKTVLRREIREILHDAYSVPWDVMYNLSISAHEDLLCRMWSADVRQREAVFAKFRADVPQEVLLDVIVPKPRLMVVHVMHGLGNRLRALASAMAFAESSGRHLILVWERDVHCGASFGELFENDFIRYGASSNGLMVVDDLGLHWHQLVGAQTQDYAWGEWTLYNYMSQEDFGAVKDEIIVDDPQKHLYFKSAYVLVADKQHLTGWDSANKHLRKLHPTQEIESVVSRLVESVDVWNLIGVHIRNQNLDQEADIDPVREYGDEATEVLAYWRNQSRAQNFFNEMRSVVGADPTARFFVASDTRDVIIEAHRLFPGRIWSIKASACDDRNTQCLQIALADMLILARTKKMLGSPWSSFTEGAQRFGCKSVRLAGIDFGASENDNAENVSPAVASILAHIRNKRNADRRKI